MKYMFFDTAINGYYTLTLLHKEFPSFKPLMPPEEKISDDVAPFIFEINSEKLSAFSKTSNISLKKIILIEADEPIGNIYNYYSKYVVQDIKGRQFYFRFWAADIFQKFVSTSTAKQLREFFGPVQKFICQDEDPAFSLHFTFNGTKLVTDKVAAEPVTSTPTEAKAEDVAPLPVVKTANTPAEPAATQQEKKPRRRFFLD